MTDSTLQEYSIYATFTISSLLEFPADILVS